MGVSVAEYYGQRTDVDTPVIQPIPVPFKGPSIPECPFACGVQCSKIKAKKPPVCCVRKSDGTLWINCPNRLCCTHQDVKLSPHQQDILLQTARHIFSPVVGLDDVCVKREARLKVYDAGQNAGRNNTYNADYIITLRNGKSSYSGPDRLVLEMQGGGETSQTGIQTQYVAQWARMLTYTNEILRQENNGVGTIETNAWRRQQEQFIVKGNVAMKTWKGYGMAFCVGTLLYDYLMAKLASANLPDLKSYNWNLAILTFKEDKSRQPQPGPIPLVVDEDRLLYTNYQTFVQALINQGEPTPEAFSGDFVTLSNKPVTII